jgi:hypothetical protein
MGDDYDKLINEKLIMSDEYYVSRIPHVVSEKMLLFFRKNNLPKSTKICLNYLSDNPQLSKNETLGHFFTGLLQLSVEYKDLNFVKKLIAKGAYVRDQYSLMSSITHRRFDIADYLIADSDVLEIFRSGQEMKDTDIKENTDECDYVRPDYEVGGDDRRNNELKLSDIFGGFCGSCSRWFISYKNKKFFEPSLKLLSYAEIVEMLKWDLSKKMYWWVECFLKAISFYSTRDVYEEIGDLIKVSINDNNLTLLKCIFLYINSNNIDPLKIYKHAQLKTLHFNIYRFLSSQGFNTDITDYHDAYMSHLLQNYKYNILQIGRKFSAKYLFDKNVLRLIYSF